MEYIAECLSEFKAYIIGALCCIGIVLLCVLLPLSLSKLDANEVGLQYNKLTCLVDDSVLYFSGLHNLGPAGTFLLYQTTQRSAVFRRLEALTADGLVATLDVTVTHTIESTISSIMAVQRLYGGQAEYDAYLTDRIEWVIRNVATQFSAAQLFSQRQAVQTGLFNTLAAMFNSTTVYAALNLVQIVNIDLPDSVEAVLNQVTTSEQDIRNAAAERSLLVVRAEIAVNLARSNATITLLRAQKEVALTQLQVAQDVEAARVQYTQRNALLLNASQLLGINGDAFVAAYVVPVILSRNIGKSIVSL